VCSISKERSENKGLKGLVMTGAVWSATCLPPPPPRTSEKKKEEQRKEKERNAKQRARVALSSLVGGYVCRSKVCRSFSLSSLAPLLARVFSGKRFMKPRAVTAPSVCCCCRRRRRSSKLPWFDPLFSLTTTDAIIVAVAAASRALGLARPQKCVCAPPARRLSR
jgi:hypothetical protein